MKGFLEISLFWGAALSLVAYEAGLLLKRKFKLAMFNPLLIAVICVIWNMHLIMKAENTSAIF